MMSHETELPVCFEILAKICNIWTSYLVHFLNSRKFLQTWLKHCTGQNICFYVHFSFLHEAFPDPVLTPAEVGAQANFCIYTCFLMKEFIMIFKSSVLCLLLHFKIVRIAKIINTRIKLDEKSYIRLLYNSEVFPLGFNEPVTSELLFC